MVGVIMHQLYISDAAAVTTAKITNWDTAYGWGDHATAGYLTSYTETDTLANSNSLEVLLVNQTLRVNNVGQSIFNISSSTYWLG